MSPTVSFPVVALGGTIQGDFYQKIFKGITEIVSESDVQGVQIYPAKWPRKVLISVKNDETKEALLISGLDIGGQHIDLRDENEEFVRITIRDLSLDYPDDELIDGLSEYGKVVKIEREMIHVDGRKTSWTTGTRWVSMCPIYYTIPQRLTVTHKGKQISMSVWYKRPDNEMRKCRKCGGSHGVVDCPFEKHVCFICQGEHRRRDCPNYDGSRVSEQVFCFMSRKSPLSNFNTNYPITIDGNEYLCNEMYIQQQKALLFEDVKTADMIMQSKDPKEMKNLGRKIRGYVDSVWKAMAPEVIMTCNRKKVYAYNDIQEYLVKTGNKVLGEATPDPFFGIGVHIGDPAVLNWNEWPGKNVMGEALTELRSEIQLMKSLSTETPELSTHPEKDNVDSESCEKSSSDEQLAPTVQLKPLLDSVDNSQVEQKMMPNQQVLLIGDSNLNGVHLDLTELNASVETISKAGAKTGDIEKLLESCTLGAQDVTMIILHIATCNWSSNEKTVVSGDVVYRNYVEAVNACTAKYPKAGFVISSVLPRANHSNFPNTHLENINSEVSRLNKLLFDLSKSETNVIFVNNDSAFYDAENRVCKDLFYTHDFTGVHISKRGQSILADNLTVGLRQALRS